MPDVTIPRELLFFVSGVVGLGGFGLVLYRYIKSREAEPNLQLELSAELHKFQGKTLCDITIHVKNVGKAAAYVPERKLDAAICSVRAVPISKLAGRIEWEMLKEYGVVEDIKYLGDRDWMEDFQKGPFIFEPGATDQYHVFLVTDKPELLWVRAILEDKDGWTWRADRVFLIPEQEQTALEVASNPVPNADARRLAPP